MVHHRVSSGAQHPVVIQAQPQSHTNGAFSLCECHKCAFIEFNKDFVLFSKHCKSNKPEQTRGQQPLPHSTAGQSASCSPFLVVCMHSLTLGRENRCHGLPFTVRGLAASLSLCNKHSCRSRSSSSSEGSNKQLMNKRTIRVVPASETKKVGTAIISLFRRKEEGSVLF